MYSFKDMNFGVIYPPKDMVLDLYIVTHPGAAVDWPDTPCSLHLRPALVSLDCRGRCPVMGNSQCIVSNGQCIVSHMGSSHYTQVNGAGSDI